MKTAEEIIQKYLSDEYVFGPDITKYKIDTFYKKVINAMEEYASQPMSAEQVEDDAINSRFDNDKFIENVCLSFNHGFGLMAEQDKQALRFECKEWMRSIKNNWKYHATATTVKDDGFNINKQSAIIGMAQELFSQSSVKPDVWVSVEECKKIE